MNALLIEFIVIMGFVVGIGALLLASRLCIQYEIGSTHLVIHWLGMPIRRIAFDTIQSIGTKSCFWAENWSNVHNGRGKRLFLRLQLGLIRHVVITPTQPYVFRARLERAKRVCAARRRAPVKTGDTEVILSRAMQPAIQASP
jgi:hypothetical protein